MSRGWRDEATSHFEEAITHYRDALKAKPNYADAHLNLGVALVRLNKTAEAIAEFQEALKSKDDYVEAHSNLAAALATQRRFNEAIAHYRIALEINPDNAATLNDLAWLRATCSESTFRDGAEAVKLAERASDLSKGREPTILDTLAAAYAESRRFPEAVDTAQTAIKLATLQNNAARAESVKARLRLYKLGVPYRQPATAAPPPSALQHRRSP
jgi:tetratricopeptide (TPR) repeat protein